MLWQRFHDRVTDSTTWNDLDAKTKETVLKSNVNFLGRIKSFESVISGIDGNTREQILKGIPPALLRKLLSNEIVQLTINNILVKPSYYLSRTLYPQCEIHPSTFSEKCNDIFVFKGLQIHEISKLAKDERIDYTHKVTLQNHRVSVRFLVLDFEENFEEIAGMCSGLPVHLILIKDSRYFWLETRGSLKLIRKYVLTEQEKYCEQEFFSNIPKRLPVCVSGEMGIGKTMLFSSIIEHIFQSNPERNILCLPFSKILDSIFLPDVILTKNKILDMIAKALSHNNLVCEILLNVLKQESSQFDVFIDDFYKIDAKQMSTATVVLKILAKQCENIRLYINTRPHMQHMLEDTLETMAVKIAPFTQQQQIEFLKNFWYQNHNISPNTNIELFTNALVKSVNTAVCSTDTELTGNPSSCCVMAKTYMNQARAHANAENLQDGVMVNLRLIRDLYNTLAVERLKNYNAKLKLVHSLGAVRSIFQEQSLHFSKTFQSIHGISKLTPKFCNAINQVGIMQVDLEDLCWETTTIAFTHKTYASYFLSEYLVDTIFDPGFAFTGFSNVLLFNTLTLTQTGANLQANTRGESYNRFWYT